MKFTDEIKKKKKRTCKIPGFLFLSQDVYLIWTKLISDHRIKKEKIQLQ